MNPVEPQTDDDLLDLIEASLFQVPLAPDEISALETETGINFDRLVSRVKAGLEQARDRARRVAFEETERKLASQRLETQKVLSQRRKLAGQEARARIVALKDQLGGSASIEGYKLDSLDDDDLNRIVAELELLLEQSQK